jgi:hypothetical protein
VQGFQEWQVFSISNFDCIDIQERYIWTFSNNSVINFRSLSRCLFLSL